MPIRYLNGDEFKGVTEEEGFPEMEKRKIVKLLRQKTEIKCHMSNTIEIPESKKESGKGTT